MSFHAAFAQGGPPLLTDDPGTPGPARWEINVALTAQRNDSTWLLEAPTIDWNYGVGERIQLNLETPWVVETGTGGARSAMGDTRIGVKWRFHGADTTLAISTYPHLTVNSPGTAVEQGLVERGTELLLPFEISGRAGTLMLNGEVGFAVEFQNTDEWLYGFAVERDFPRGVGLLAEIHGVSRIDGSETELVWDIGARKSLSYIMALLVAAGTSLPGATNGIPHFLAYIGGRLNFGGVAQPSALLSK